MQQLGPYQIKDLLGEGSFASVYRAFDQKFERDVALKILKPVWLSDPQAVDRFKREAKTMAKLRHPHIVDVFDVGEGDGSIYLAQLLVEGETLTARLKRGPLAWPEMLSVLQAVAAALDYAHEQGVVHRDIKPSNILLDKEGQAYLGDFGLVRAAEGSVALSTTSGGMIGTPAYMAPEQWEGKPVSAATDVYALSCVVVEMLTGTLLFDGSTPPVVMRQHLIEGPQFPDEWPGEVPEGVNQVLQRGLVENPADRISTAGELSAALVELSAPVPPDTSIEIEEDDEMPTKPRVSRAAEVPSLWLVAEGTGGQSYQLKQGSQTLGRSPSCDIQLDDLQASREHAVIKFDGQRCVVYDKGSANGTFVNKEWVGPEGHSFNPGDQLVIGDVSFTLNALTPDRSPAAIESPPPPLSPPVSSQIATKRHLGEAVSKVVDGKPGASPAQTVEVIGFGRRLVAFMIDTAILQTGVAIVNGISSQVTPDFFGFMCVEALIYAVYFVAFWSIGGQTPGKMMLGIKVISTDGSPVSLGEAILRYIGYAIGGLMLWLGFFWVAFDTKRQGWHDKMAGTYVVRKNTHFSSHHAITFVPSDAETGWIWIALIILFAVFVCTVLFLLVSSADFSNMLNEFTSALVV